ncbi:hypothetical protein D3C72_848500 [compost metagenome]
MSRSAVFLDEMGVGPLWRLRQGAAPETVDTVVEAPVEMEAAVAPGSTMRRHRRPPDS